MRWSARAIKSFAMAELEARKLKYPNTGTEALLMGILVEDTTSIAAKFLRQNGITLFKIREEIVNLMGKSDMYFFSPEHPPLTEPAQRALDWAVETKLKSGEDGEITTAHLLLGIWSQKESAGHKILASFGFNDEKATELTKYSSYTLVDAAKYSGNEDGKPQLLSLLDNMETVCIQI
ncbi:Clp, repeat (R) domain [Dillenia turbinata]|uniref:Clp, repeat (R) domain n=1 Tax=Dillenia turbinata TaxID=194707 RepID=A0AAN8V481_9MAGN